MPGYWPYTPRSELALSGLLFTRLAVLPYTFSGNRLTSTNRPGSRPKFPTYATSATVLKPTSFWYAMLTLYDLPSGCSNPPWYTFTGFWTNRFPAAAAVAISSNVAHRIWLLHAIGQFADAKFV